VRRFELFEPNASFYAGLAAGVTVEPAISGGFFDLAKKLSRSRI
jgi:hypothetical protein